MHIDRMLSEWTAPLCAQLGIDWGTAVILLIALYVVVKWAVKNGVKEALRIHELEKQNNKQDERTAEAAEAGNKDKS